MHIHCASADEAAKLDDMLWTFRDKAFVPHALEPADEPVAIGHAEPAGAARAVLVNLGAEVPDWFARFERVAEIVGPLAAEKAAGRTRFRFYKERGFPLETHELGARP